jgi:hypothetical protein
MPVRRGLRESSAPDYTLADVLGAALLAFDFRYLRD